MPFWTQVLFFFIFSPIPCLVWLPSLRWACHFSSWNSLVVSSFKYAHKTIIGLKMSLKRCGDGLMAMHVMWVMRIFTSIPLSQSLSLSLISDLFIYLPHFCSHCLDNNNPKSYRMFWQCCSGISLRGATALRWWNWALIGLIGFAAHSNSHYWDWPLGEIGPESMTKQKKARV